MDPVVPLPLLAQFLKSVRVCVCVCVCKKELKTANNYGTICKFANQNYEQPYHFINQGLL